MKYTITPTEYDQHAAGMTAAAKATQNPATIESTREYLIRTASEQIERYTRATRNALHWAKIDREAGDRAGAAWDLWSASQHRQRAAEWIARYNRAVQKEARA